MAKSEIIYEAYRGFGAGSRALMSGRLYRRPAGADSYLARIRRRGIAGVEVRATLADSTVAALTDADGYVRLAWDDLDAAAGWHEVAIEPAADGVKVGGAAEIHMRPPGSRFVVVSDIDDTVMVTGVANKAAMYWRLFFRDAGSRRAFPGVPEFYRALAAGASGEEDNPLIFISRGPWAICDVVARFFRDRQIAERPILLLREWGLSVQSPMPRRARDHKRRLVDDVMEIYGDSEYVLIGDNGQHDPDLYAAVARDRPGRIRAVYIREIDSNPARRARIERIFGGTAPPVLVPDTATMAAHAAATGLIAADAAAAVGPVA